MHNIIFVLLRRMHLPLIFLICIYAISVLGFVLISGTDNQGNPWRMDFFHAFYFVSFMGTTIGFGEIPYPFNNGQRLWAIVTIYGTVIAWLYAIGSLLSLIQDPAFRTLMKENAFRRAVRSINEPFYLICGYGDTGSLLVRALSDAGIRSVVIDADQERVNALELEDLLLYAPGFCANAAEPDILLKAGLKHKCCAGVVALTNVDHVNLKISITGKLLNPSLQVIARAETRDAEENIASFGTDSIINPFDTFAGRLALALHSPGIYLLYEWMAGVPNEGLSEPLFPPRGRWILCGFGRFGKAVYEKLEREGLPVTVIEATPEITGIPEDGIVGRGTEAVTLEEAKIQDAVGIIAGTDDDANNLSIIMTARELKPELFIVARQNKRINDSIFAAANLNLIMQRSSIIAHKIFAFITVPIMDQFFTQIRRQRNDWANELVSRISGITQDVAPHKWMLNVLATEAPALVAGITDGKRVSIDYLLLDPRNREDRLPCIVLLIKRQQQDILLPKDNTEIMIGDRILLCARYGTKRHVDWFVNNYNVFNYVFSGEEHSSNFLMRRLKRSIDDSELKDS